VLTGCDTVAHGSQQFQPMVSMTEQDFGDYVAGSRNKADAIFVTLGQPFFALDSIRHHGESFSHARAECSAFIILHNRHCALFETLGSCHGTHSAQVVYRSNRSGPLWTSHIVLNSASQ
jgi:hypothetical protein